MNALPRPEYPRPQARRERWLNLNGPWGFAEDPDRGADLAAAGPDAFPDTIIVPFCRESGLSGIGRDTPCSRVWYSREIDIPAEWRGSRVLLQLGAADYETTAWVDGRSVAPPHRGGHSSFSLDLTDHLTPGATHRLTLRCEDDPALAKPCGKQRRHGENSGCHYVQTTGIWQTVWLEPVPVSYLDRPRITPSVDRGEFRIEQRVLHPADRHTLRARLRIGDRVIATEELLLVMDACGALTLPVPPEDRHLWEPGAPFLYDLEIELEDETGRVVDRLTSYAGLRSVAVRGTRVLVNGKPVFQRLVLDQGYYPDGLLTAPHDDALEADITHGLSLGFNGARLHQKIFEERTLYHADRHGYLVWGELPDWGPAFQRDEPKSIDARWIEEWLEAMERDYSHPCVIGWCPLNEQEPQNPAHRAQLQTVQRSLVLATKGVDRTRPVLDASGWAHFTPESDLYDDHTYEQDPERLAARYAHLDGFTDTARGAAENTVSADGKPFFVSEMAGIKWTGEAADEPDSEAWGYGKPPATKAEFLARLRGQCAALAANPRIFGYCVTQLTDVFQERNGMLTFDRRPKFDPAEIRAAQSDPAGIEAD